MALAARSGDELAEAAGAVEAEGGVARAWTLDVADLDAVAGVVGEVEAELGPVTLLVNNAGTAHAPGPMWEVDPDDWWRDLEVHVRGAFNCCRVVLPGMVRQPRAGADPDGGGAARRGRAALTAVDGGRRDRGLHAGRAGRRPAGADRRRRRRPLSGRFLHARDDLDALLADAGRITADDLLTLRLREWPGG